MHRPVRALRVVRNLSVCAFQSMHRTRFFSLRRPCDPVGENILGVAQITVPKTPHCCSRFVLPFTLDFVGHRERVPAWPQIHFPRKRSGCQPAGHRDCGHHLNWKIRVHAGSCRISVALPFPFIDRIRSAALTARSPQPGTSTLCQTSFPRLARALLLRPKISHSWRAASEPRRIRPGRAAIAA